MGSVRDSFFLARFAWARRGHQGKVLQETLSAWRKARSVKK